jgi:hypothetical protein
VRDRSGQGVDLHRADGRVVSGPGVHGRAALFEGGRFTAAVNPLRGASRFSIALWFKTAAPRQNYKLAAAAWWRGGPHASGWDVGTHYPEFWADGAKGSLRVDAGWERKIPLSAGEWNHLAVVYDGREVREYVNGRVTCTSPGSGEALGAGAPMEVGSWMGGFRFHGFMDDLRLYGRALSEPELRELARFPSPATSP